MPQHYWELTQVEILRREDGNGFRFIAVLDGPPGQIYRLPLTPDEMFSYIAFQKLVLTKFGGMFLHVRLEGRRVEAADEFWRRIVESLMKPVASLAGDPSTPPN